MKKLLAMLLAAAMVFTLAACGNGDQGSADSPAPETQSQAPESQTPETPEGGETAAKTVKVGLICIGDENDQGYTYNFIRGQEAATEALAAKGINVE